MPHPPPLLANPTVYESLARTWFRNSSSATTNITAAAATTATASKPSSSDAAVHRQGGYSWNLSNLVADKRTTTTTTSITGRRTFSSFTRSSKDLRFIQKSQGQIRNMASTQPLTQSTIPTAQELRLETTPSDIKTVQGVKLDDGQQIIVASVLDLFLGKASLRKLTLWEDSAVFNDPITVAEGRQQYAAQWYGLATAFSSITRLDHLVTSAGNPITLDLKTLYKLKGVGTEKQIDSKIEIWRDDKTGKIAKVRDMWDGEIGEGGVKHAFRKLNSVTVPAMVSVPKSIEEEEGGKK